MRYIRELRGGNWAAVPTTPGVYWWYFDKQALKQFGDSLACDVRGLNLLANPAGEICLYHGIAKNLRQRIAWHSAQSLHISALKSGFLSTFRLTLLALNTIPFVHGEDLINAYMDTLRVDWVETRTKKEAMAIESAGLAGPYHFPLNIQSNNHSALAAFKQGLKAHRAAYRHKFLCVNEPS